MDDATRGCGARLNDIYVMPATGGTATVIHSGPATQRSPQFSPDGKTLLYLSDESGADNVWISAIDGSNPITATLPSGEGAAVQDRHAFRPGRADSISGD